MDQVPVEIDELLVFMSPGISPAVIRISPAYLTSFISVVDGGGAGPGHLDRDGLPEDPLVDAGGSGTGTQCSNPADHPVGTGQEAGVIMVGELVHRAHEGRIFESGHLVRHDSEESRAILVQIIPVGVGMLFHAGEEPGYRFHKGIIIHDAVPFTAVQPGGGITVMLRHDQRVGIDGFDTGTEVLPEFVVEVSAVAQVCGNVQTPAVDAIGRRKPFFGDFIHFFTQVGRIFIIQLRQGRIAPPALIHGGSSVAGIVEVEIGTIGTVDTLISTGLETGLSEINPFMIHPLIERTAVVEDTVQDNLHSPAVEFLAERGEEVIALFQVFLTGDAADIFRRISVMLFPGLHNMIHIIGNYTEVGIDMLIVLTIVFMAGGGNKDRVEIKDLDPQILQIIQLIQNALEIAAVEAADIRIARQGIPVIDVLGVAYGVIVFIVHYIVGWISVAEAIREDLVLNGALGPVRDVESGNEAESIGRVVIRDMMLISADTAFIICDFGTIWAFNQETVDNFVLVADYTGFIIIKKVITFDLVHHCADRDGLKKQNNTLRTVPGDPQTDPDSIPAIRFRRKAVVRGLVAEDGGKNRMTDSHEKPPESSINLYIITKRGNGYKKTEKDITCKGAKKR